MIKYLFEFLSIVFSCICYILMLKNFDRKDIIINKKVVMVLLLYTIIITICGAFQLTILNLIFNLLLLITIKRFMFNDNFKSSLFYSAIIIIITLTSDAITSVFLNESNLINRINFERNIYLRTFLMFPVYTISYFVTLLPFVKKIVNSFFNKYISKIKINIQLEMVLITMFSIIVISFCIYGYNEVNRLGHIFTIISIVMLIIVMIAFLYMAYNDYQYKQSNSKIIQENLYIKSLSKKDAEFKHNLVNNLLGVRTIANKKAKLLIDDLINSYQTEYKTITNINDLPNGIQSIIYKKSYESSLKNLNLIVNNSLKKEIYDFVSPKNYNKICTSIGILFDNALDAVKNCKYKIIIMDFYEDSKYLYLKVQNNFNNTIDLEEIGNSCYTSKNSGHGIGLHYVKKQIGVKLQNKIINDIYISTLVIEKIK